MPTPHMVCGFAMLWRVSLARGDNGLPRPRAVRPCHGTRSLVMTHPCKCSGKKQTDAVKFTVTTKSNGENGKWSVRSVFGDTCAPPL